MRDLLIAEQYAAQGKLDAAKLVLQKLVLNCPFYAEGWHQLGVLCVRLQNLPDAASFITNAVALNGKEPVYHNNLANVLKMQGKFDEALASYQRAIELQPDFAEAHHNSAFLLLQRGEIKRGWAEYEWRWKCPDLPSGITQPWDGTPAETVVLHSDQGAGDTFQFVRYAHRVKQRANNVFLRCKSALIPLLKRCPGVDACIPSEHTHDAGAQVFLTSLPHVFGTDLDTIPRHGQYIFPDKQLVCEWREKIPTDNFTVGIAWQGNPKFRHDKTRSIPVEHFGQLRLPGVQLVSLQKYDGVDQDVAGLDLLDFPDKDTTAGAFSDTAAVIANLDLVITSDTSIAHLAGAMGVPVWVVLSYVPEWRWLLGREDSPWYPTMRLFRQSQPGDWGEVFVRVVVALREQL